MEGVGQGTHYDGRRRAVEQRGQPECEVGGVCQVEGRLEAGAGRVPERTEREQAAAVVQAAGWMPGAESGDGALGKADGGGSPEAGAEVG